MQRTRLVKLICASVLTVTSLMAIPSGHAGEPLYQNDFEKEEPGSLPEEFLVLDGQFEVKEEGGNRFLELPGAPLDTFGAMFGSNAKDGVSVSARILGTARGRRYPTFAVSLNGITGYKLQVTPAKKAVELFRGDELLTSVDFDWESGKWTDLFLQVRKTGESEWTVEGRVRQESIGSQPPDHWTITHVDPKEPISGRAAVWGSPFSGRPIRFDDLKMVGVEND